MAFIKYTPEDGWNEGLLEGAYKSYFNSKLNILQQQQDLSKRTKAEKIATQVNGVPFELSYSDLATAVNQALLSPNITSNLEVAYQQTINAAKGVLVDAAQYGTAMGNLLAIRTGLINQEHLTINYHDAYSIEEALKVGVAQKGNLSNRIGALGEATSSLAGAAALSVLSQQIYQQLGSIPNISLESTFENVGASYLGSQRSLTDNRLTTEIFVNGVSTGVKIVLNFSDKANQGIAKISKKRATGHLTMRNSTVAKLMEDLNQDAVYNTISYHKKTKNAKEIYAGMHSGAGNALSHYFGYKMLIQMLIDTNQLDNIDFVVYGNKLIPEDNIVNKLLEKKEVNYRYQAQIRYWRLKNMHDNNELHSTEQAEHVIDTMPVQIGESFNLS